MNHITCEVKLIKHISSGSTHYFIQVENAAGRVSIEIPESKFNSCMGALDINPRHGIDKELPTVFTKVTEYGSLNY